jgi:hypothetical protein
MSSCYRETGLGLYENRFFFKRKITSLYFIFIGVPNFICKKARPKSFDGVELKK